MSASPAAYPGGTPAASSGLLSALSELSVTLPEPGSDTEAMTLACAMDALAAGLAGAAEGLRARRPSSAAAHAAELTVADRLGRVDGLDLEPVVYKLTHPEPGAGALNLADADRDVALYRCFLKLCVMHPGHTLVPSHRLDHVWHTHLLDTAKYRDDCDEVFGRFMDHFPYFGMGGHADQQAWRRDFGQTRRLFAEHFQIDIGADAAASACASHGDGSDCCAGPVPATRPRPDRSTRPDTPGQTGPSDQQGSEATS